jgi:predicted DNA-binding protein
MPVDRLSVTVPTELGAALRALAEARGATVSTIVTEAIEHRVRLEALDVALAEADRRFGAVRQELVEAAAAELVEATKARKPKRRRRTA